MKEKSRKPDFNLWATNPDETCRGRVGGAWKNDDGTINIKLDPFVVLEAADGITVKLFPYERTPPKYDERKPEKVKDPAGGDLEDDIPF